MTLFRLKTVKKSDEECEIVSDLDKLTSEPVWFKFQGKAHKIAPITAGSVLMVYEKFHKIDSLIKSNMITPEDLISSYSDLFSTVCPTIGRKEVEGMSQTQAGALFTLIFETVTGKAQISAQKKNPIVQSQSR